MDYNYVNPIFLHHLPVGVGVGVGVALSSLGDDDNHDEKAAVDTLESVVDQATRLVSTSPLVSTTITYDHHGSNIKMNINDDMSSRWFGYYNPQQITTRTMAVNNVVLVRPTKNQHHHQFVPVPDNSGVVLKNNNTYGSEIEHQFVSSKQYNNGWMAVDSHDHGNPFDTGLLTYATTTRSVVLDNHAQNEESKEAEKHSTTSCTTNKRSKATILHKKVERKRRDKINQRMEALQRLVPNICYKTDKATILDQVIEYIKKLQNQRDQLMMMSSYGMNNNMTHPMMMPMSYYMYMQQQQQQLQMSMMPSTQMGMGVDLGSMHTNPIMHPNMNTTGTSRTPAIVHPLSIIPSSHNH